LNAADDVLAMTFRADRVDLLRGRSPFALGLRCELALLRGIESSGLRVGSRTRCGLELLGRRDALRIALRRRRRGRGIARGDVDDECGAVGLDVVVTGPRERDHDPGAAIVLLLRADRVDRP
jgi:hypothetical protein